MIASSARAAVVLFVHAFALQIWPVSVVAERRKLCLVAAAGGQAAVAVLHVANAAVAAAAMPAPLQCLARWPDYSAPAGQPRQPRQLLANICNNRLLQRLDSSTADCLSVTARTTKIRTT